MCKTEHSKMRCFVKKTGSLIRWDYTDLFNVQVYDKVSIRICNDGKFSYIESLSVTPQKNIYIKFVN